MSAGMPDFLTDDEMQRAASGPPDFLSDAEMSALERPAEPPAAVGPQVGPRERILADGRVVGNEMRAATHPLFEAPRRWGVGMVRSLGSVLKDALGVREAAGNAATQVSQGAERLADRLDPSTAERLNRSMLAEAVDPRPLAADALRLGGRGIDAYLTATGARPEWSKAGREGIEAALRGIGASRVEGGDSALERGVATVANIAEDIAGPVAATAIMPQVRGPMLVTQALEMAPFLVRRGAEDINRASEAGTALPDAARDVAKGQAVEAASLLPMVVLGTAGRTLGQALAPAVSGKVGDAVGEAVLRSTGKAGQAVDLAFAAGKVAGRTTELAARAGGDAVGAYVAAKGMGATEDQAREEAGKMALFGGAMSVKDAVRARIAARTASTAPQDVTGEVRRAEAVARMTGARERSDQVELRPLRRAVLGVEEALEAAGGRPSGVRREAPEHVRSRVRALLRQAGGRPAFPADRAGEPDVSETGEVLAAPGMAYVVRWADGRAVASFRSFRRAQEFAAERDRAGDLDGPVVYGERTGRYYHDEGMGPEPVRKETQRATEVLDNQGRAGAPGKGRGRGAGAGGGDLQRPAPRAPDVGGTPGGGPPEGAATVEAESPAEGQAGGAGPGRSSPLEVARRRELALAIPGLDATTVDAWASGTLTDDQAAAVAPEGSRERVTVSLGNAARLAAGKRVKPAPWDPPEWVQPPGGIAPPKPPSEPGAATTAAPGVPPVKREVVVRGRNDVRAMVMGTKTRGELERVLEDLEWVQLKGETKRAARSKYVAGLVGAWEQRWRSEKLKRAKLDEKTARALAVYNGREERPREWTDPVLNPTLPVLGLVRLIAAARTTERVGELESFARNATPDGARKVYAQYVQVKSALENARAKVRGERYTERQYRDAEERWAELTDGREPWEITPEEFREFRWAMLSEAERARTTREMSDREADVNRALAIRKDEESGRRQWIEEQRKAAAEDEQAAEEDRLTAEGRAGVEAEAAEAPFQQRRILKAGERSGRGWVPDHAAETPEGQTQLARLHREVEGVWGPHEGRYDAVTPTDERPDAILAADILGRLGRAVRFVRAVGGAHDQWNGAVGRDGVIYINASSDNLLVGVAGHEFVHTLPGELRSRFVEAVRGTGRIEAYASSYDGLVAQGEGRVEELAADWMGQQWRDRAFWEEVAARTDEGTFRTLVRRWAATVNRVVAKVRELAARGIGVERYDVDAYLGDLAAAKEAAIATMADYIRARRRGEQRIVEGAPEIAGDAPTNLQARRRDAWPEPETARAFVLSIDGSANLGAIDGEVARAARRQAGPIRLTKADDAHIRARHGEEIARHGFEGREGRHALVRSIADGYTSVHQGRAGRLLLVRREGATRVAAVELRPEANGDYWAVETAWIGEDRYLRNKELLWERAPDVQPPASAVQPGSPSAVSGQRTAPSTEKIAPEGEEVKLQRRRDERKPDRVVRVNVPARQEPARRRGDPRDTGVAPRPKRVQQAVDNAALPRWRPDEQQSERASRNAMQEELQAAEGAGQVPTDTRGVEPFGLEEFAARHGATGETGSRATRIMDRVRDGLAALGKTVLRTIPQGGTAPADELRAKVGAEAEPLIQSIERAWWEGGHRAAVLLDPFVEALRGLTRTERRWFDEHFMWTYEDGRPMPELPDSPGSKARLERVAGAWESQNRQVGREAEALEVETLGPDGDWQPFAARDPKRFVPHKFGREIREALQQRKGPVWVELVDVANTQGIPVDVLRALADTSMVTKRHGSLEHPRLSRLPRELVVNGKSVKVFDTDSAVLVRHLASAGRRLALIDEFGQHGTPTFLEGLTQHLVDKGLDAHWAREAVPRIWERLQGEEPSGNPFRHPALRRGLNTVEAATAATNLSAAVIPNLLGGPLPEMVRFGALSTLKHFVLAYTTALHGEGRDAVVARQLGGVGHDFMRGMQMTEALDQLPGRVAKRALQATGFAAFNERINLAVALGMARTNLELMTGLIRDGKTGTIRKLWGRDAGWAQRYLRDELGFSERDIARMADGGTTEADLSRAIQKQTELVNAINESPMARPIYVANPLFRMVFAYSTYVRKFARTVEYSVREAGHGNVRPLVTLLAAGVASGEAIIAARDFLKDREREDKTVLARIYRDLLEVGAFGMYQTVEYGVKHYGEFGHDFFGDVLLPPQLGTLENATTGLVKTVMESSKEGSLTLRPLWRALRRQTPLADIAARQVERFDVDGIPERLATMVYTQADRTTGRRPLDAKDDRDATVEMLVERWVQSGRSRKELVEAIRRVRRRE